MNIERKEDLIEQYEDAAFALMMSNYAEQEGNRLLQKFEEAKARGEVPAVPVELDAKCRKLIHNAYEKERNQERIKKFLRMAGRTAAIWFVAIGICATLVLSVEALRTPVINFIIEQHEKFTTIHLGEEPSSDPSNQPTTGNSENVQGETPLDGLLPDGYDAVQYDVRDNGTFVALYKNVNGDYIMLCSTNGTSKINLDTEAANTRVIQICGHDGYFIEEGSKLTIFWFDENQNYTYQLRTTNCDFTTIWFIAENYIMTHEGE